MIPFIDLLHPFWRTFCLTCGNVFLEVGGLPQVRSRRVLLFLGRATSAFASPSSHQFTNRAFAEFSCHGSISLNTFNFVSILIARTAGALVEPIMVF
jgi:hypothetical protein